MPTFWRKHYSSFRPFNVFKKIIMKPAHHKPLFSSSLWTNFITCSWSLIPWWSDMTYNIPELCFALSFSIFITICTNKPINQQPVRLTYINIYYRSILLLTWVSKTINIILIFCDCCLSILTSITSTRQRIGWNQIAGSGNAGRWSRQRTHRVRCGVREVKNHHPWSESFSDFGDSLVLRMREHSNVAGTFTNVQIRSVILS